MEAAPTTGQDLPFDRRSRRLRRDRAASTGVLSRYAYLILAEELLARLDLVNRRFETALELGFGGGPLAAGLRERGIEVVSADAGRAFAAEASGVQCDEDRLPFADGSFDLVVSAGVLDSVNDLPGALILVRRVLRPDGLFLAVFPGAGSLPRLRSAIRAAEAAERLDPSPRLHPQIDVRAAGDLLVRAGFALPVADADNPAVRFPSLRALVGDLRGLGMTNILVARSRRPFGRVGLAAAEADFAAQADTDGKTNERFSLVYLSGWAPSPDQPQPARRGSATASLAEALKRKP